MPQAFTGQQMEKIREALFQSACRHAVQSGTRRTSMEMLTQEAGISKSTFYKFFDSKEQLFLKVAQHFEWVVISEMKRVLHQTLGQNSKERTAAAINAAFVLFAQIGAVRFFKEDLPELVKLVPLEAARDHLKSMAEKLIDALEEEEIRFCQPREVVISVIHLLYLAVPSVAEVDHFIDAFHVLVLGACHQVVAE